MVKRIATTSFVAVLCWTCVWGGAALAEDRLALVIGNSDYTTAPLPNPVNDAVLMTSTLEDLGFTVKSYTDLDRRNLQRAVVDFGKTLETAGEGAVALIYYAGHGVQIDGENYLIPVDAQISDPLDVKIEGIRASTVLETLNRYDDGLNIVVLDACRDNPFESSTRSSAGGLARMDAPTGTLVAFSTAPGRVAEDGRGGNSPYTKALAKSMRIPGLKVEDVFKRVRVEVLERTNRRQVPWESSSLVGDFYFSGPPQTSDNEAKPEAVQPVPSIDLQAKQRKEMQIALADPLPAPGGFLFPDSLPGVGSVQEGAASPIDGVWRLNITNTRFRIEKGRVYTVDGYHLLPLTSVSPGKVTGRDLRMVSDGRYSFHDLSVDRPGRMQLRPDRTLYVVGEGLYEGFFTLLAPDDPNAFEKQLATVRAQ